MAEYSKEKYYWLKLDGRFFKRHDIRIVETMPNGKDYILFYLKLLCESVYHNGELRFSEQIPYSEQMLSTITDTNVDLVRSAVKIFTELHMMEMLDDGTIYMGEVKKMIGYQTKGAETRQLQRQTRESKIAPINNSKTTIGRQKGDKCPPEKDKELEKELEKDKELEKESIIHCVHNTKEMLADDDVVDDWFQGFISKVENDFLPLKMSLSGRPMVHYLNGTEQRVLYESCEGLDHDTISSIFNKVCLTHDSKHSMAYLCGALKKCKEEPKTANKSDDEMTDEDWEALRQEVRSKRESL